MALTFTQTEIILRASFTILHTTVTFDSSYATSGETLSAASVGLREINYIIPGSSEGFEIETNRSTPQTWLIQAFANSASTNTVTEFASGLDRTSLDVDLLIIGR